MIKLFWNTHNQKKPSSSDKKIREKQELDYRWGQYHKKSSDKWIYEILKKIDYKIIENEDALENDDILIIVDSSVEEKNELYTRLKLICSKIFLFHLGDEFGFHNLSTVYSNCNHVWRSFCSSKYFKNDKVNCIPLGYKSGVLNKKKDKRKYKWAFTGTPHKSSRHDLLFQFSGIKPFFCHKTEKFGVKNLSVDEMNEVLSSSEFLPCPYGFFHPDSYRLYEALECGCIPIVENAYQYYDRLYPNNPFLKVDKWGDAKSIMQAWGNDQIKKKQEECIIWWSKQKNNIQDFIKSKIKL
tara:strand:+ start:1393 stop:2283 length:891 start_codon:yes stop_codon:yes gene_type:complete